MRFTLRRKVALSEPSKSVEERFWSVWDNTDERAFSEISDPLEARLAWQRKISEADAGGDTPELRRLITCMIRQFPCEPALRLVAASLYQRLGDEAEAMTQLAVVIAIAPEHSTAYLRLARSLCERGEHEAALAVLEAGWVYRQRQFPRNQRLAEKVKFFSILDAVRRAPTV